LGNLALARDRVDGSMKVNKVKTRRKTIQRKFLERAGEEGYVYPGRGARWTIKGKKAEEWLRKFGGGRLQKKGGRIVEQNGGGWGGRRGAKNKGLKGQICEVDTDSQDPSRVFV